MTGRTKTRSVVGLGIEVCVFDKGLVVSRVGSRLIDCNDRISRQRSGVASQLNVVYSQIAVLLQLRVAVVVVVVVVATVIITCVRITVAVAVTMVVAAVGVLEVDREVCDVGEQSSREIVLNKRGLVLVNGLANSSLGAVQVA